MIRTKRGAGATFVVLAWECLSPPARADHCDCDSIPADWCKKSDDATVVCLDYQKTKPVHRDTHGSIDDDTTLIPPNQKIQVVVLTCDETKTPQVTLGGDPAEGLPAVSGDMLEKLNVAALGATQLPLNEVTAGSNDGHCKTTTFQFAPRGPGPAILSVTLKKVDLSPAKQVVHIEEKKVTGAPAAVAGGPTGTTVTTTTDSTTTTTGDASKGTAAGSSAGTADADRVELLVPHVYSSALRVGLGLVGGASDHTYSARKAPGSDVATIVDNGGAVLTPEIVLGFAPFLDDLTRTHGRVYTHYRQSLWHIT